MKKTIKGLLTVTAIFALGACTPDEKESASSSSSTKESTEVSSGASAQTYTNPADMKEEYDLIIVGGGGAGMAVQSKQKMQA